MLEHALGDAGLLSGADADMRCAALIGRTLLQASSAWSQLARGPAGMALDCEAERFVASDPQAAERALEALHQVSERLRAAIADTRLARTLGEALIRAANALPDAEDGVRLTGTHG